MSAIVLMLECAMIRMAARRSGSPFPRHAYAVLGERHERRIDLGARNRPHLPRQTQDLGRTRRASGRELAALPGAWLYESDGLHLGPAGIARADRGYIR